MGKRGSVLLHVLMTGALLALISATVLRLAMLRYMVTARTTNTTRERRYDEAAVSLLVSKWNATNVYCASVPSYYNCSGGGGVPAPLTSCTCTCNPVGGPLTANFPTVTNANAVPPCQLTVQSTDMQ